MSLKWANFIILNLKILSACTIWTVWQNMVWVLFSKLSSTQQCMRIQKLFLWRTISISWRQPLRGPGTTYQCDLLISLRTIERMLWTKIPENAFHWCIHETRSCQRYMTEVILFHHYLQFWYAISLAYCLVWRNVSIYGVYAAEDLRSIFIVAQISMENSFSSSVSSCKSMET